MLPPPGANAGRLELSQHELDLVTLARTEYLDELRALHDRVGIVPFARTLAGPAFGRTHPRRRGLDRCTSDAHAHAHGCAGRRGSGAMSLRAQTHERTAMAAGEPQSFAVAERHFVVATLERAQLAHAATVHDDRAMDA